MRRSAVLLVWGAVMQAAVGRPDGEPWPDACESMSPWPRDGVQPQTGPMPFGLEIDDTETTSDGCIYVVIRGNETNEFAGFMVQARNESGVAVGKFLEADDVKLANCFGTPENTAITINYLPKEDVTMRWLPDGFVGTVNIYATVAKDYMEQVYWLKQKTKLITVKKAVY